MKRLSKKGFTLIELLVVISIIGLLSSVVFASLDGARMSARNAKRLQIVSQYMLALEFVRDDLGEYPTTPGIGIWTTYCLGTYASGECLHPFFGARNNTTFDNLLAPYMPGLPIIPDAPNNTSPYITGASYACAQMSGGRCIAFQIFWVMEQNNKPNLCGGGTVSFPNGPTVLCHIIR